MKYKRFLTIAVSAGFCAAWLAPVSAGATQTQDNRPFAETARATDTGSSSSANVRAKDEVVYATLAADGSVEALYAVNRFEVTTPGKITDHGDYTSVTNLTNTDVISQSGSQVEFTAAEGNFYYQGNMKKTDLPWDVKITYTLDGKPVNAAELAGASGKLKIGITSSKNTSVDDTFYDNYMLQITANLDTDRAGNIVAGDATVANAGKSKAVAFTVLPGKDADFSITADVTDFEMPGISINAMPYSMSIDFPDMDDQFEDLEKLPEAIADLDSGVGELDSGAGDIKKGAAQLVEGSAGVRSGLNMLKGNSSGLVSGSSQIKGALSQIATSLKDSGLESMDLSGVTALPDGLNEIAGGIDEISAGLTQLTDGYNPAYNALDGAMSGIPAPMLSQEQIQGLYALTDPSGHEALNALVANYTAAQTAKGTYDQTKPAFAAVPGAINQTQGGLSEMSEGLNTASQEVGAGLSQLDGLSKLGELSDGLQQLSTNYGSFHSGLSGYLDGVSRLANNYGTFHNGLSSFSSGVGKLNTGIGELHDGTSTLRDEVADLPDVMQEEIDKMKEQYLPADFDTISFTSEDNNTEYVQFIIQSAAIEKPEEPEPEPEPEPELTFMDRFTALFN